ncbi:MAG: CHASE2 domain-containing protein [Armatimonadota bacterium]
MAIAATAALVAVLAAAHLPPLRALEMGSVDRRLALPHRAPSVEDFVIVAIEDATFDAIERWGPSALDRAAYAAVIDALSEAGARSIGVDVFFAGASDPETDAALAKAIARAGNVVLVAGADAELADGSDELKQFASPLDSISRAARTVASPLLFRPDGVVRWVDTTQSAPGGDTAWPALSRAVLLDDAKDIPERVTVNWAGPSGTVQTVLFEEIHAGRWQPSSVKDRFVLIGVTDDMKDLFETPVGPMSGVEIHAQAAATMLSKMHISASGGMSALIVALLGALTVALVGRGRNHWWSWGLAAVLAIAWTAATVVVFRGALILLPVVGPSLAFILTGVVAAGLQSNAAVSSLARIWPGWASEEGEQLEVTVLVCDMAGYTARSERVEPTELMTMMREFFSIVDDVVGAHGGVSARRPGDAAVVFFRPEGGQPHHAARAVEAARELRERLEERWPEDEIGFGITLTTGEVSLGWVGEAPPEPQILGDPVNVAFRLQGECRERDCPILTDWETATADEELMAQMRPLGQLEVRNRTEPVRIFTPAGG